MSQTTVTISTPNGPIVGQSDRKEIGPLYVINQAGGVIAIQVYDVVSTGTTITPPTGSVGALIAPQPTNTFPDTLILKGATTDTGIHIQAQQPMLITFATPLSSFHLHKGGGGGSIPVEVSFF